jgi:uncharacterized phage-associated protein
MTYSPITIANYFIKSKSKFGQLTPMKILKLVYLADAWYMTLEEGKEKLVSEKVQAWDYGPVFPNLYRSIKTNGRIDLTEPLSYDKEEIIKDEDVGFLERIWKMYGKYDGIRLSAMTHKKGTPWEIVYCKGCNSEIPNDLIIHHYKPKLVEAN